MGKAWQSMGARAHLQGCACMGEQVHGSASAQVSKCAGVLRGEFPVTGWHSSGSGPCYRSGIFRRAFLAPFSCKFLGKNKRDKLTLKFISIEDQ